MRVPILPITLLAAGVTKSMFGSPKNLPDTTFEALNTDDNSPISS